MKNRFTVAGVALLAALPLALVACSPSTTDGGSGGGGTGSASPTTDEPLETIQLTVGVLPIIDSAAFQIALDEGYFEEEALEVTAQTFPTGAASTAAVLSGDVQIGWTAINASLNALSQNVPILAVAPGAFSDVGENDSGAIIVAGDSEFQTLEDLSGGDVAIIALQSLAHLETIAAFEVAGVDSSTVNYVEIGFADIGAAIEADRIDAGLTQEPFRTILLKQGMREISNPVTEIFEEATQTTEWVTSQQFAGQNPEAIERFQRAIGKANEFAAENPDTVREAVLKLIPTLDSALVADLRLPTWRSEVDRPSYDRLLALLTDHSEYSYEPDFDAYLQLTGN